MRSPVPSAPRIGHRPRPRPRNVPVRTYGYIRDLDPQESTRKYRGQDEPSQNSTPRGASVCTADRATRWRAGAQAQGTTSCTESMEPATIALSIHVGGGDRSISVVHSPHASSWRRGVRSGGNLMRPGGMAGNGWKTSHPTGMHMEPTPSRRSRGRGSLIRGGQTAPRRKYVQDRSRYIYLHTRLARIGGGAERCHAFATFLAWI